MVTLHGAMGYGVMVLHDAENYNKVMAPCDHGALANGAMQYNHGALRLGTVQKGSDREIFTDPVHFVFKFKRVSFSFSYCDNNKRSEAGLMVEGACTVFFYFLELAQLTIHCGGNSWAVPQPTPVCYHAIT
jgi:hypothetical protein